MTTTRKNETNMWGRLRSMACAALLVALGGTAMAETAPAGEAAGETAPPAGCVLATIDGVPVTEADAQSVRALLQPPPSAPASRRLAVDAALAWWDTHGWLAGSSARGRLDAWRAWLSVGTVADAEALDVRRAAADIAAVAARAGMTTGACGDPRATTPAAGHGAPGDRGRRAAALLERSNADLEPRDVRLLRVASLEDPPPVAPSLEARALDAIAAGLREQGVEPDLREVELPLRQLEPALALAAASLTAGDTAGPIPTPSGTYWLEKRQGNGDMPLLADVPILLTGKRPREFVAGHRW